MRGSRRVRAGQERSSMGIKKGRHEGGSGEFVTLGMGF